MTGPMIGPGTTPSMPSGTGSAPDQLEATPSADPTPKSGASGARNSTGKANYEAFRTPYRASRPPADSLAKSAIPPLEPAPRSVPKSSGSAAASSNPLDDNLGPLLLPSKDDPTNYGSTAPSPPAAPAANRNKPPSAVPAPAAETRTEAASAASASPPSPVSPAPGLRRFSAVDAKLAGGSVPNRIGLEWLEEKGYKTLLDLREPSEVQASFIADVTNRGLATSPCRFPAQLSMPNMSPVSISNFP